MRNNQPPEPTKNSPTHFREGSTLNSRLALRRPLRCSDNWPCKRMTCPSCRYRRRNHFINNGVRFAEEHGINVHCVVSWPLQFGENPWGKILRHSPVLSKAMSGKIGKYIRTIGIGERCATPHVHYLVQEEAFQLFREKARQLGPQETLIFPERFEVAQDLEGLLGYFFDRNFLLAFLDSERPKRTRIISGSRGLSYGFPGLKNKTKEKRDSNEKKQ